MVGMSRQSGLLIIVLVVGDMRKKCGASFFLCCLLWADWADCTT